MPGPGLLYQWANNKKLTQNSKTSYFSAIDFSQGKVESQGIYLNLVYQVSVMRL